MRIISECVCNFGFVETGRGAEFVSDHIQYVRSIIQVYRPDGQLVFSNRETDEEMDDLEMRCIRCGGYARFE